MTNLSNRITTFIRSFNFFSSLKTYSLLFLKNFIKLNIRVLFLVTENKYVYLIYIFCIIYSFFGHSQNSIYTTLDLIGLYGVAYLIFASISIYLACKIKPCRVFIDNLVSSEYIIKYLGVCTGSAMLVKVIVPVTVITAAEIVTDHSAQFLMNNKLAGVIDSYKLVHPDLSTMPPKMQSAMFEEITRIRRENPQGGMITLFSNQLHKEALVGGFSEGAGGFLGGLYGGIFGKK